ncbi:hypothetical protein INR49_027083 [Caranx melampygus]|nr:hypothetical protein INR49_027083 [Caranx melampygus]
MDAARGPSTTPDPSPEHRTKQDLKKTTPRATRKRGDQNLFLPVMHCQPLQKFPKRRKWSLSKTILANDGAVKPSQPAQFTPFYIICPILLIASATRSIRALSLDRSDPPADRRHTAAWARSWSALSTRPETKIQPIQRCNENDEQMKKKNDLDPEYRVACTTSAAIHEVCKAKQPRVIGDALVIAIVMFAKPPLLEHQPTQPKQSHQNSSSELSASSMAWS